VAEVEAQLLSVVRPGKGVAAAWMDLGRETAVDIPDPAVDMDRMDSSQGSMMVLVAAAVVAAAVVAVGIARFRHRPADRVLTMIPSAEHCRRGRDLL
jgi:hypothetical protein